jgi:tetratricopeptide (TPR) repeat protein
MENNSTRILFLAPDPSNAARLRLGEELRNIQERLERTPYRLESRWAVRPEDVLHAILEIKPHVVHFSGHGLETGEICLQDNQGNVKPVQPKALAELFRLAAEHVKCVVINTCYAEEQAKAIAEFVPFVIGMKTSIGDQAAITFAKGFYIALQSEETIKPQSIERAFGAGSVAIRLDGISKEHLTPILFGDPRNRLRSEIDAVRFSLRSQNAMLTNIYRMVWQERGKKLGLRREEIEVIISSALRPIQDIERQSQKYEQAFKEITKYEFPPSEESRKALQALQTVLGLQDEIVAQIENRIASDPHMGSPQAYLERGSAQSQQKDYQKAIEHYTQALELKPDYSHAYLARGFSYYHLGDKQKAIADYSKAIEIDTDWGLFNLPGAYLERAFAHEFLKDAKAAFEDYTQAIALKPSSSRAYLERGYAHYQVGDREAAIKDYTQAIEMNSDWSSADRSRAYLNRGLAYYYSENMDAAVKDWTETINQKSNYSLAYYNRGLAYSELGNKDAAIQDYTKAIEVNGDWGETRPQNAYLKRGFIYLELNNKQAALKDFQEVDAALQIPGLDLNKLSETDLESLIDLGDLILPDTNLKNTSGESSAECEGESSVECE